MRYAANLNNQIISGFEESSVAMFFAVELEFDTFTHRGWTGYGQLTLQTDDYTKVFTGEGDLLAVSEVSEDKELSSKHMILQFNGLKASNIDQALSEEYQFRKAKVYIGCIYDDQSVDHYLLFSGFISDMSIAESDESMSVSINLESKLSKMERANVFHYTDQEQRELAEKLGNDGIDKALSRIVDIQDANIVWKPDV